MRGSAIEQLAASLTPEERSDVIGDVELLLDAHANGSLDLSPAFERLLLDLLEQGVATT